MKFVVSSTELLSHLQSVSRVISSKNTLPILDNFLFSLSGTELEITASDLETTLITKIKLENASDDGKIAVPAKILGDTLKEFPEQPLTFEINTSSMSVVISSENGQFTVVGQNGDEFPQMAKLKEDDKTELTIDSELLLSGITKALFATADDELRPVMNGILLEISEDNLTFVASDAHKLVRYKRMDGKGESSSSFILPKKPASLLKNILPKEDNVVKVEFDNKNASFTLTDYTLVCRLVEGNYPSYNSVIPTKNPNKLTIGRQELYNSLKRVSVFSNQASNLVKLKIKGNQLTVSAQDIDFSISAYERLNCQYDGDDMEIGFKSTFMIEILANLHTEDIVIELSDPTRAGLILPTPSENKNEDVLMLLMPMMINV
ncbi:MAG: DNA polymerase III subunit beta [Bacteroidales bacterium]|nr:DNA polymerase III subunit beta [Bacteroidales bacterium]MCF8390153.1 DNA polymerase III subunit beta [Bacteroidales bacterium]